MTEHKDQFNYKYSAPTEKERKEVEYIKSQYLHSSDSNSDLNDLKKLDQKVKKPALIIAYVLGVFGTLVFGFGLSAILEWGMYVVGIISSVIGLCVALLAYPIYGLTLNKRKEKYASQIIEISNKILNR